MGAIDWGQLTSNFGNTGHQPNFPGTQNLIQERMFRKRFRDKSILPAITNSEWKGRFKNSGTVLTVPVLPLIKTEKTTPGGDVKYQEPKSTDERFYLNRERYYALRFIEEDQAFSAMDIKSPVRNEASAQLADDMEEEFTSDVYTKVHSANQGKHAGFRSQSFDLGTSGTPVSIYKTDAEASGENKASVVDYLTRCIACLREMPGGKEADPWIVIPTCVAHRLQTSEMKQANMMGDSESLIRKNVVALGSIGGATVFVDDKLPMWNTSDSGKIYNILFGDNSAVTFVNEVTMDDPDMKDVNKWGIFYRTKVIYDWFVRYPERLGTGFVKLG